MVEKLDIHPELPTEINFPNSSGRFRVTTTSGSEFEFRFNPNCSLKIKPGGDIADLSLIYEEGAVPDGKLKLVDGEER